MWYIQAGVLGQLSWTNHRFSRKNLNHKIISKSINVKIHKHYTADMGKFVCN